ncbi:hypothetical protein HETIRDRAFT_312477 [Heterobasidion irregulare TC 32-1]|uniref:DUF6741 domain-containing protein n=1 Tax=Heterobasidion irregulare (strain TC 32-1) TaxID=747525 RepID=W4KF96_HETIT|nr:uncharacterized protein HETIRDRAFT_312477 [Heterobasidion irregulare TC 32-1]ETW84513.1 hypothetical protein HETIRDRAFT_312477 [Heterobasidion irregulare TC 32-1]
MTPFPSQYSKRGRRSSMSSMYAPAPMQLDGYRHAGGVPIKFRIKNSSRSGVSVHEIMSNMRLSGSHDYTFRDMKVDHRGRLMLKIRWNGYRSLMYEIPVSGHDGGYVNIQSFSRRVARAVVHFLAANAIQIPWDRVLIHRLEETAFGTWQPVLSTI